MSRTKHMLLVLLLLLSAAAGAAELVNVNAADAEALASGMVGIGPAKAAAIVAYREQHGPFKSVDDLLLVKGIGESTLEQNRDRLTAATP